MCRRFAIESLDLFDVLEPKLSMSSLVVESRRRSRGAR